jgi:purine-binding chemotaxis protein CheW
LHFSAVTNGPAAGPTNTQNMWLLCSAGSSLCALPLAYVVEMMRPLPIERVAGAPLYVRGLSIIRGTPTPVVDTALLCSGHAVPSHRLVTVKAGSRVIALAVDRVLGVRWLKTDEPLPPLLREAASDMVSAIGRLDAGLLLFLSTARIVPEELFQRLDCHETVA